MRIFKLFALLIGTIAISFGINACNKDKGKECCTFSYRDGGVTYTYEACDDGIIKYSTSDGDYYTYSWKDDYDSWAEVKNIMISYGATCD